MLRPILLLLLIITSSRADEKICTKSINKGSVYYDLNALKVNDPYKITNDKGDTFWLNICGPLGKAVNEKNEKWKEISLYYKRNDSTSFKYVNFPSNGGKLSVNGNGVTLALEKAGGNACEGKANILIYLFCNKDASNEAPAYVYDDDCYFSFFLMTSTACPTILKSGMSGFSVFLLLLFISFGVYFIGGVLYNRYQGKIGIDQIPHLGFWERVVSMPVNFMSSLFGRGRSHVRLNNNSNDATMLDPELLHEGE